MTANVIAPGLTNTKSMHAVSGEIYDSVAMNAVGNGISGLVSGFMGGYIGLSLYIRKRTTR